VRCAYVDEVEEADVDEIEEHVDEIEELQKALLSSRIEVGNTFKGLLSRRFSSLIKMASFE
jgi:hypothetical protein